MKNKKYRTNNGNGYKPFSVFTINATRRDKKKLDEMRRDKNYLQVMNDEYFKEKGFVQFESRSNGISSRGKNATQTKPKQQASQKTPVSSELAGNRQCHQYSNSKTTKIVLLLVSFFLLYTCASCGVQKVSNDSDFYLNTLEPEIIYHKT